MIRSTGRILPDRRGGFKSSPPDPPSSHAGNAGRPRRSLCAGGDAPGRQVKQSLCHLGMAGDRISQPHRTVRVVNAVPEPAGSGHLVLPLLHGRAVDEAAPQAASKRMLPCIPLTRIARDPLPRSSAVGGCGSAHIRPSGYRFAGRVSEVPLSRSRRRRDAFPSLRHALCGGQSNAPAGGISRPAKPPSQLRIRVDLCRRPPLTYELAHWPVRVEVGRGSGYAGKLLDKRAPICTGQELEPRKCVTKRIPERPGVVDSQVAQRTAECGERRRPLRLPVRPRQPQIGFVATAKDDIPFIYLDGNVLRVSEEI